MKVNSNANKTQNIENCKKIVNSFYNEEEVILEAFEHIKSTNKPIEELSRVIQPKKIIRSGDNEISNSLFYSYDFDVDEFIKESNELKHKTHSFCEKPSFQEYYPTFSKMSKAQLNWYLYWREKVTNGEYPDTDLSYIYVFAYELMNYSFNQNAAFNISMLKRLYDAYYEQHNLKRLIILVADMLFESGEIELGNLYYKPTPQVPALYKQLQEKEHDLSRISITLWKSYAQNRYLGNSKFFEPNKNKIYKTFKECVHLLDKYYKEMEGKKLIDVYFETKKETHNHFLFGGMLHSRNYNGNYMEFKLDNIYPTNRLYTEIVEYFRLSENVTRLLNGEKRQIKCNESVLPDGLKEKMLKVMKEPKEVGRFKTVQKRKKENQGSAIPPTEEKETKKANVEIHFDDSRIQYLAEQSENLVDEVEKRAIEYIGDTNHPNGVGEKGHGKIPENETSDSTVALGLDNFFSSLDGEIDNDDFESFVSELSTVERGFLQLFNGDLSCSKESATQFVKIKGSILGVLFSQLNEKAQEHLEDNLLEIDGEMLHVFEEFKSVLSIVKGKR